MKYFSVLLLLLTMGLGACHKATKKEDNPTPQTRILGVWSSPSIEFKGFDKSEASQEELAEYEFMLGGLSRLFESMTIEFFEDGVTKDSYQISMKIPGEAEPQKEFGEYELRANGKRLIIHDQNTRSKVDVELAKLTNEEMQWRMQFSDLAKFGGQDVGFAWDEAMPNMVLYMTFRKAAENEQ